MILARLIVLLTKIPEIYIMLGGCPIFKGGMAGKIRENEPKHENPLL